MKRETVENITLVLPNGMRMAVILLKYLGKMFHWPTLVQIAYGLLAATTILTVSCQTVGQKRRSNSMDSWSELMTTTKLEVWESSFRLNTTIATPTETWGVKFSHLQSEFVRITGVHLPLYISPSIAIAEVLGWEETAYVGGPGHMRHVSVKHALWHVCELNGMSLSITSHGAIIEEASVITSRKE